MNLKEFSVQEITSAQFRTYLISKKVDTKWFYWHLKSNLNNYKTYKLTHNNYPVGVFCIENKKLLMADLYIDEKFRRLGYGKFIAKYIASKYDNIQFKVNIHNFNSINFFEFLYNEKTVMSKKRERGFVNYILSP